jgi:hypothetical protein
VWRYAPAGSIKIADGSSGSPRRNNAVEMWTGRWRKVKAADGTETYAKCLIWAPLDTHINGRPGISKFAWYQSVKGFHHPLDDPQTATAEDIAAVANRARRAAGAVQARMEREGLNPTVTTKTAERDPAEASAAAKPAKPANKTTRK